MTRLTALRLVVASSIVVVFTGAAMVASQRSAANMATAANTWLGSPVAEAAAGTGDGDRHGAKLALGQVG